MAPKRENRARPESQGVDLVEVKRRCDQPVVDDADPYILIDPPGK